MGVVWVCAVCVHMSVRERWGGGLEADVCASVVVLLQASWP